MTAVAVTGSLGATALVSIIVPVSYAVANGVFDFVVRWTAKGKDVSGSLMIWVDEGEEEGWRWYGGGVDKLATFHKNGRHVTYVERSVRLREANPYSLGLNLTLGAIAVDLAAILAGEVSPVSLIIAILSHTVILIIVAALLFMNQSARPNQIITILVTAGATITLGIIAIMIALLIVLRGGT